MRKALVFAVAAALLAAAFGAALAQTPVTGAKIKIDGRAEGNGYINLKFTPSGGEAQTIQVPVVDRDREEAIAQSMAKALTVALGEGYKVDTRGNDKVEVKTKDKKKPFTLVVAEFSVKDVSVKIY